MPRQSLQYPPATRRRGALDTRTRRRRQPARYRDRYPYPPGYGYGGPVDRYGQAYRSQGAYNRAQLVRTARRVHATAKFGYRVGRGAIRHRRRLAGLYTLAGIAGIGLAASLMPSGMLVAGIASAGQVGYGALKHHTARKRARANGEPGKLTAGQVAGWAARLATAAWLPLTAAFGFAAPLRLMLAAGASVALPWWAVHTRPSDMLELEEPERIGDEELHPICAQWLATVGAPGGMLSGSYLIKPEVIEDQWLSVLQLVPGRQRPETALGAVALIASAYGVDPTRVSVTRMPDGRADQVAVAVYYANPLQQVHAFTRPTLDVATGWVTVGLYPDGTPARWRLYEPGSGPCGGLIFGAQGSGKSGLANQLAAEITHCGFGVLFVGDGQEGLSMPDWIDHGSKWFGYSLRETRRVLQGAERIMYSRQKRRRRIRWIDAKGREHRGKASFDATPQEPYLYVIVDEWPIVALDPECRRIVALLLKAGRKVGITCIVIGQIPSVAEFGGDNDASVIRSLASTTNVAMFRLAPADKASQHMGGMGVDGVDPTSIPPAFPDGTGTQGMGYLRAPGGAAAVFRSNWVRDPLDHSETAIALDLEPDAIDAAGDHYQDWRERYALVLDGEDDPADLAEDEEKAATAGIAAPLARIGVHDAVPAAVAGVGQVVPMPQNQALNPRDGALAILRGTGQILSTAQITSHVNALTGADHSRDSVQAALRRALTDGEVVQYPALPTGKDRSARWIAAEHATEERNA